jgi:hypothetical protein
MTNQADNLPKKTFDLTRQKDGFFAPIALRPGGGVVVGWLSIQGSQTHYCSPQKTLARLLDYRTVELCLTLEPGLTLADLRSHLSDEVHSNLVNGAYVIGYTNLKTVEMIYQAVLAAHESKAAPQAHSPNT